MMEKINTPKTKRPYVKPEVEAIKMDHEISMVMMSAPPGDPEGRLFTPGKLLNPLKWFK